MAPGPWLVAECQLPATYLTSSLGTPSLGFQQVTSVIAIPVPLHVGPNQVLHLLGQQAAG